MSKITRRTFLRRLGAGALAGTGALLARHSWAAGSAGSGRLRMVVYSDVHARTEWGTPEALGMAAEAINRRTPDIIIACGDLITDGFESSAETVTPRWDAYMDFHRALQGDLFPVIGNHDLVAAMPGDGSEPAPDPRSVFRQRLGVPRTWYAFDALGHHFVILDSIHVVGGEHKYQGLVASEQLDWIAEDLAGVPADRPVVLALHIPLVTGFYQLTEGATQSAPASRVVVNNRDVLSLFRNHRLELVLQGHLHVSELIRWGGTRFVTAGALSGKWWRGDWHGTPAGFTVLTLEDGRVDWEYVSYGWEPRRPVGR